MDIKFSTYSGYEKDLKALSKKYPSLPQDLEIVKKALSVDPILSHAERIDNLGEEINIPIYKARKIACKSLKDTTKIRLIYAYDQQHDEIYFIEFIELYTKSDKDNEDRERIKKRYQEYCLKKEIKASRASGLIAADQVR